VAHFLVNLYIITCTLTSDGLTASKAPVY